MPKLEPTRSASELAGSPIPFPGSDGGLPANRAVATRANGDSPLNSRSGTARPQCGGDAHLSNFGWFASPDRRLVFDINDFDETQPSPWEWDLKRLAALVAASYDNGHSVADHEQAGLAGAHEYPNDDP